MDTVTTDNSKELAAKALYEKAVTDIKQNKYSEAEQHLLESININPTAEAYHNLGALKYNQGKIEEAVQLFHSAVLIEPEYDESYASLMRIMRQQGNIPRAIEYSAMAMTAAPQKSDHQSDFITLISNTKFLAFSPDLKRLITFCLENGNLDYERLQNPWISLYYLDPEHAHIYNLSKHETFKAFEKAFSKLKDYSSLNSRFFILGLENMIFGDIKFERLLTHLRRLLLKDYIRNNSVLFGKEFLLFTAALSTYCYYTEYVFDISEEEKIWIEELRLKLEQQSNISAAPYALCLFACYEAIHLSPRAQSYVTEICKNELLKTFAAHHLIQPLREQELKNSMPSITTVFEETSLDVQEQYEQFPYPRWRALPRVKKPEFLEHFLESDPIKILVAGAGTGREALTYAKVFPNAEILAVDLSKSSLSYAQRKAMENNLNNIVFRQADILALGSVLKCEYDLIVSCGVLHHLKNPEEGLSILVDLLKPQGIMHLAFYSEIARQGFVAGQKAAIKKNYSNDAQGIRIYRRDLPKLVNKKDYESIITARDFYFLSECRDLLFHVMEHRLTIPQLKDMFLRFHLKFLGFSDLGGGMLTKYDTEFANDPLRTNLDNWDKLEHKYPNMFRKMYQFWVKKP